MTMNLATLTMRQTVTAPADTFLSSPDPHRRSPRRRCVGAAIIVACLTGGAASGSELMGPLPGSSSARRVVPPAPRERRHEQPPHCKACQGDCRGGACAPHCPVRPDEFGFYETQWRTWPRTAASGPADAATVTPASPPPSEVPGVDEESLPQSTPAEGSAQAEVSPLPTPRIPVPDRSPDESPGESPDEEPREAPAEEPVPQKQPAKPAPVPKPSEDENLFDEAARRLPRTALLATLSQRAARERSAAVAVVEEVLLVGHEEEIVAADRTPRPEPARAGASANPLRAGAASGMKNPLR